MNNNLTQAGISRRSFLTAPACSVFLPGSALRAAVVQREFR